MNMNIIFIVVGIGFLVVAVVGIQVFDFPPLKPIVPIPEDTTTTTLTTIINETNETNITNTTIGVSNEKN